MRIEEEVIRVLEAGAREKGIDGIIAKVLLKLYREGRLEVEKTDEEYIFRPILPPLPPLPYRRRRG